MKKKILAFMLTLVTVIAMIPVVAFASGPSSVIGATPTFATINVGDVQNIVVEIDAPAEGNAYSCRQLNTPYFVEVSGDTYFSNGQSSVTIPVKGTSIGTETLAFKLYKNGSVVEGGSTVFVEVTVAPAQYTVTFDSNGGEPQPENQVVDEGGKVVKPATDPVKEGFVFGGWYNLSAEGPSPWNFDTGTVTKDMTLTASWKEESKEFTVELDETEYTYDGKSHVPEVTVKDEDGNVLTEGFHVSIAGGEVAKQINAGEVEIIVYSDRDDYKNTKVTYTINPAKLQISLDKTEFVYNGQDQIPNVTVTGVEGDTLSADKDYEVTFGQAKRIDVGTYTVKAASFNNNYVASDEATFKIVSANENVPKTGDSNNAWLYVLVGVLALGTALGAGVVRKKANR